MLFSFIRQDSKLTFVVEDKTRLQLFTQPLGISWISKQEKTYFDNGAKWTQWTRKG
jgi:hypothetical protein